MAAILDRLAARGAGVPCDPRPGQLRDPVEFAAAISSPALREAPLTARRRALEQDLFGVDRDAKRLTPSQMIKLSAEAAPARIDLEEYSAVHNLCSALQAVARALPSVASGIRTWARFCSSAGLPFAPTEGNVLRYSSMFSSGKTFGLYLAHLKKYALFLDVPLESWYTSRVKIVAQGLKRAHTPVTKIRRAVTLSQMRAMFHRHQDSEIALLFAISWIFLLRIMGEGVELDVFPPDTPLDDLGWVNPSGRNAISYRKHHLVIRLVRQKIRTQSPVLVRGCSCGVHRDKPGPAAALTPTSLCPVHVIWARLAPRAGRRAFGQLRYRRLRSTLEAWLEELGVVNACEFGLHSPRRGAARALLDTSQDVPLKLAEGRWGSARAASSYLDRNRVTQKAIQETLGYASDSDSGAPSSGSASSSADASDTSSGSESGYE